MPEAIDSLNPQILLLLKLHYVDSCTMREISEIMGITKSTFQNRLLSRRKKLKKEAICKMGGHVEKDVDYLFSPDSIIMWEYPALLFLKALWK